MEAWTISSLANRVLTLIWPWKTGPLSNVYRILLQPGLSPFTRTNPGSTTSEVGISLVARPDYLQEVVRHSYESMKFLHGKKLPLQVRVTTRSQAKSLRYGLVQADHSVQVKGEKRLVEELLGKVRDAIERSQREPRLDSPQVIGQASGNWLQTSSAPVTVSQNRDDNGWLGSLGAVGLTLGIIAALTWLSKSGGSSGKSALQTAVTHLRKRGANELQLLHQERVDGGEKFYFQGPTDNYTVIVDKNERVYSWSRVPSEKGGTRLE